MVDDSLVFLVIQKQIYELLNRSVVNRIACMILYFRMFLSVQQDPSYSISKYHVPADDSPIREET